MLRMQQLLEFLKDDPADVFTLYALALENININEQHTAIELLNKVITLNPEYVAAYYQLGQLLEKTNANQAAIIYKQGIEVATRTKNSHARSELSTAYSNLLNDD